jgi:general secretion pathway protein J
MRVRPQGDEGATAGFTLAEVLVSLAILGLMLVLLFGNVRFEARAWQSAATRSDRTSEMETVTEFMRRQLGQAYPYYDQDRRQLAFDGGPNALRFKAPVPAHLAGGGIHDIAYSLVSDAHGRRLVMSRAPHRPAADPRDRSRFATETTLVEGVESVEFAYFGRTAPDRPGQWHSQWADASAMPSLIRVHFRFPDGDGRVWPDLLIRRAVDLDAVCVYDSRQRRCRNRE